MSAPSNGRGERDGALLQIRVSQEEKNRLDLAAKSRQGRGFVPLTVAAWARHCLGLERVEHLFVYEDTSRAILVPGWWRAASDLTDGAYQLADTGELRKWYGGQPFAWATGPGDAVRIHSGNEGPRVPRDRGAK